MHEFAWIEALRKALGGGLTPPEGIGDDAAILRPDAQGLVVASDLMAEGVHYRSDWSRLEDVAFKLYASNASDMLAMGATPEVWMMSVALERPPDSDRVAALCRGFLDAQQQWGEAPLIGGDTTSSRAGDVFCVTMFGKPRAALWTRDGFQPGDMLWVDGPLGWAAAGLARLEAGVVDADCPCIAQQRRPQASVSHKDFDARGAIDISDGLVADLYHCAEESSVHMVIDRPLPGDELLHEVRVALGVPDDQGSRRVDDWQLYGGEDYVRVVGFPECPGEGWHQIGYVARGEARVSDERTGTRILLPRRGWDHFRR